MLDERGAESNLVRVSRSNKQNQTENEVVLWREMILDNVKRILQDSNEKGHKKKGKITNFFFNIQLLLINYRLSGLYMMIYSMNELDPCVFDLQMPQMCWKRQFALWQAAL